MRKKFIKKIVMFSTNIFAHWKIVFPIMHTYQILKLYIHKPFKEDEKFKRDMEKNLIPLNYYLQFNQKGILKIIHNHII